MNTENDSQLAVAAPNPIVVEHGNNIEVTASTPDEFASAQSALIVWAEKKLIQVRESAKELRAAYEVAMKRKWAHATLKRHAEMEDKRCIFYDKVLGALRLGFMIVPNFPVTAFAIRTDRKKPLKMVKLGGWADNKEQKAGGLEQGEGEYKNPFPLIYQQDYTTDEDKKVGKKTVYYHAGAWDEMEFPVTMAKSHIIEAVSRVMALKLFDDFGILPAAHVKQDPMIIARLKDPRPVGYGPPRYISFMIAWHLDTEVL